VWLSTAFRCRVLDNHRWQQLRQDEETYFECIDCKKRRYLSDKGLIRRRIDPGI
jgi:hypothetical protein